MTTMNAKEASEMIAYYVRAIDDDTRMMEVAKGMEDPYDRVKLAENAKRCYADHREILQRHIATFIGRADEAMSYS